MADSFAASAFADNFTRGFSFVDQIKARGRAESRLEDQLKIEEDERAFQRRRTQIADRQVLENRGFAAIDRDNRATDRSRRLNREDRAKEATRLMADPEGNFDALQEFADFQEVSAALAQIGDDRQRQADFETAFGTGGDQNPAFTPSPEEMAAQEEEAQAQRGFGPALAPPGDEFATAPPSRRLTNDELNDLADTDPDEAIRIRDEQNANPEPQARPGELPVDNPFAITDVERKASDRQIVDDYYAALLDINVASADQLRDLDPSIQAAKYWEDRNNLSPERRKQADAYLGPIIAEASAAQQEIYSTAEPGSREHSNAKRKLQKNYGLQLDIAGQASPADTGGVRGNLPHERNADVTSAVIDASHALPGNPLIRNPKRRQADVNMVRRPSTRVNKRKSDAAYRLLRDKDITRLEYDAYINTGKFPSTTKTDIVARDPKKNYYLETKDAAGNVIATQLFSAASDPDKPAGNVLTGDALTMVRSVGKAYDTADDPQRGTNLVLAFQSFLEQTEAQMTAAGYAGDNVQDMSSQFNRYMELVGLQEAYDDELSVDWNLFADFHDDIGSIANLMYGGGAQDLIDTGEFEDVRTGETIRSITPLKQAPLLTAADIANIKANVPDLANASDEEIQAAFDAQQ